MIKYFLTIIIGLIFITSLKADNSSKKVIVIKNNFEEKIIGDYIEILQIEKEINFAEIPKSNEFILNQTLIPNLGLTPFDIWLKFTVKNEGNNSSFLLDLEYPMLDEVEFFYPQDNNHYSSIKLTEKHLQKRKYKTPNYVFDLNISTGKTKTYYIKLKNTEQIILPITIKNSEKFWEAVTTRNIINGIYIGIILIMFIYNLFVLFSTREKSYFFYVLYVISTGLTQMGIQGYSLSYFFPGLNLDGSTLTIYASLAGISVIMFTQSFLEIKNNAKKSNYVLNVLILVLLVSLVLAGFGIKQLAFNLMQMATTIFSFYILFVSYYLLFKGHQSAKFFALAWSVLLFGAIIFLLKDYGVLPYNTLTNHSMQIATGIEMALLSFALANRINIFRKEKVEAQEQTVEALQQNEKIIKEQNVVLEQKVEERTTELNQTLNNLKEAQSQLVDAEKMSSLGQLTAGIAHEINNPINFVSSNISPLREDIKDVTTIIEKYEELETSDNYEEKLKEIEALKKELDYDYLKTELTTIINGIEDGAKRTTEIVNGLRNFSRLDESEIKNANINEGIDSTVLLIKNKLNGIELNLSLSDLPPCECNPGKINQLTMNLIDNAIYAIHQKKGGNEKGLINIITENNENSIILIIKDNGIGIPDVIKNKLYDPFFTTKDVGEGTGLGLSIVRNIIESHNGRINIISEENKGTEVTVTIPIKRKKDEKN